MAIYLYYLDGGGEGRHRYRQMRHPDDPPPYAFYLESGTPSLEETSAPPGFSQLPLPTMPDLPTQKHASVYQFVRAYKDGDDTIWEFKLFRFTAKEDAIAWMRKHVSPDESNW